MKVTTHTRVRLGQWNEAKKKLELTYLKPDRHELDDKIAAELIAKGVAKALTADGRERAERDGRKPDPAR